MSEKISFDDAPESKQYKSIQKGGIHRGFHLEEVEFSERKEKTKKQKDGTEVGTGEFIGPSIRFTFQNENTSETFTSVMFEPPTRPEDVKFTTGYYEKGVEIRKKTPEEQIKHEFLQRYYFYEQLAKALLVEPTKYDTFKRGCAAEPAELFKKMFKVFFDTFPLEKYKSRLFDFKTMFKNDEAKKTSFLQLCYVGANNLIFAPYIESRDSMLSLTPYEVKLINRKYSNTDRVPTTDSTEVVSGDGAWKPVETDNAEDDKPLF